MHVPNKRWVSKRTKTHLINHIRTQLLKENRLKIELAECIISGNIPTVVITNKGSEMPKIVTWNKKQQELEQYIPIVLQCSWCQRFWYNHASCWSETTICRLGPTHKVNTHWQKKTKITEDYQIWAEHVQAITEITDPDTWTTQASKVAESPWKFLFNKISHTRRPDGNMRLYEPHNWQPPNPRSSQGTEIESQGCIAQEARTTSTKYKGNSEHPGQNEMVQKKIKQDVLPAGWNQHRDWRPANENTRIMTTDLSKKESKNQEAQTEDTHEQAKTHTNRWKHR